MECEVRSGEWVWSGECEMWSKVWSVEWEVRSEECEAWSVVWKLRSVVSEV